jgi:hypothetical protein
MAKTVKLCGAEFARLKRALRRSQLTAATDSFADGETPTDSGDHQHFGLIRVPVPALSLILPLNGIVQNQGQDYTLSGNQITFANALTPPFTLLAWYRC